VTRIAVETAADVSADTETLTEPGRQLAERDRKLEIREPAAV
jgi:hypothetical protein